MTEHCFPNQWQKWHTKILICGFKVTWKKTPNFWMMALSPSSCLILLPAALRSFYEQSSQTSSTMTPQSYFNKSPLLWWPVFNLAAMNRHHPWHMHARTGRLTHTTTQRKGEGFVTHLLYLCLSVWCLLGVHKRVENSLQGRQKEAEKLS